MTAAEIYARIVMISELVANLSSAQPERLNKLYDAIGLELRRAPDEQRVHVSTTLRVALTNVSEGYLRTDHTPVPNAIVLVRTVPP